MTIILVIFRALYQIITLVVRRHRKLRNLFLIYADKKLNGQDPEFFNTGGVAAPTPKQFTLTLRLGL